MMHLLIATASLLPISPVPQVAPAAPGLRTPHLTMLEQMDPEVRQRIEQMQARNQQNGVIVLGGVLAICVWLFSVPPDIRRANICSDERSSDCVELPVLARRVARHYETCGREASPACFALDFSIDPRSRAAFDATVDSLLRGSDDVR